MPIYCDESGYTGINLLEENQPYFALAAVNIDEKVASDFVSYLIKKYKLQGSELKGSNLLKSNNGRTAIKELFVTHGDKLKVIFHDKKFVLACKYFEYVFEPVISDRNEFFYSNNFHFFISNILHEGFVTQKQSAEEIFESFISLLKGDNINNFFNLVETSSALHTEYWKQIARFTFIHRETILDEITTAGEVQSWVMDINGSTLYDLLCTWGVTEKEMVVICDQSKPIKEALERYELLRNVGMKTSYLKVLGRVVPITFNLKQPIQLSNSKDSPGIQIADVFASSITYALKNRGNELSKFIRYSIYAYSLCHPNTFCVMPDHHGYFKESTPEVEFNVHTLNRFVTLSEKGLNILENFLKP